jgi:hypothetical protein
MLRELRATMAVGSPSPECLDEHIVAALADGTLEAGARGQALVHVAGCARCRGAVALVARALADRSVARAVAAIEAPGRRWYRIAVPVAAAAIVLVVALPRNVREVAPAHRAPTITAVAAPVPIAPVGAVSEAQALRWEAVDGVDRYRVTLYDAGSRVLYEVELADTVAALPDSVRLAPGRYLWKVDARTGWDRWTASRLVEFRVVQGGGR